MARSSRSAGEGQQSAFEAMCPDGTPLNEAVSVLIKELRRGKELEALYWARQIEQGGFYKYVWRRLAIFCAEDVGMGNPLAITVINALWQSYETAKKDSSRGTPDGNLITMAVMLLARSEKNRECDHLKNAEHSLVKHGWKPEIPDYAIDMHTRRGRGALDKAEQDRMWFTEWSVVVPEVGPFDWRAWHWKRLANKGAMDAREVSEKVAEWAANGDLLYGVDGIAPVPRYDESGEPVQIEPDAQ